MVGEFKEQTADAHVIDHLPHPDWPCSAARRQFRSERLAAAKWRCEPGRTRVCASPGTRKLPRVEPATLDAPARRRSVRRRSFEHAQARAGDTHLHFEIPPIRHFAHPKPEHHISSDSPKRTHVSVGHPIERPYGRSDEPAGDDLDGRPC